MTAKDEQALRDMGVKESKIADLCNDPKLNVEALQEITDPDPIDPDSLPPGVSNLPSESELIPEAIVARLFNNNDPSDVVNNWDSIRDDILEGEVTDGYTMYTPEERTALNAMGMNNSDLKYLPPTDYQDKLLNFVDEEGSSALGAASSGKAFAYAYIILIFQALSSWYFVHFCWSAYSAHIYTWSSLAWLGIEATLISFLSIVAGELSEKIMDNNKKMRDKMAIRTGDRKKVQKRNKDGELLFHKNGKPKMTWDDTGAGIGELAEKTFDHSEEFADDVQKTYDNYQDIQSVCNNQPTSMSSTSEIEDAAEACDASTAALEDSFDDLEKSGKRLEGLDKEVMEQVDFLDSVLVYMERLLKILPLMASNTSVFAAGGYTGAATAAIVEANTPPFESAYCKGGNHESVYTPSLFDRLIGKSYAQTSQENQVLDKLSAKAKSLGLNNLKKSLTIYGVIQHVAVYAVSVLVSLYSAGRSPYWRAGYFGASAALAGTAAGLMWDIYARVKRFYEILEKVVKGLKTLSRDAGKVTKQYSEMQRPTFDDDAADSLPDGGGGDDGMPSGGGPGPGGSPYNEAPGLLLPPYVFPQSVRIEQKEKKKTELLLLASSVLKEFEKDLLPIKKVSKIVSSIRPDKKSEHSILDLVVARAHAAKSKYACFSGDSQNPQIDPQCQCQKSGSCTKIVTRPMPLPKGYDPNGVSDTMNFLDGMAGSFNQAAGGSFQNGIATMKSLKDMIPNMKREQAYAINFNNQKEVDKYNKQVALANRGRKVELKEPNLFNMDEQMQEITNTIHDPLRDILDRLPDDLKKNLGSFNNQKLSKYKPQKSPRLAKAAKKMQGFFKKLEHLRDWESSPGDYDISNLSLSLGKVVSSSKQKKKIAKQDEDEYMLPEINKNSGVSIFKIISTRYFYNYKNLK